MAAVDAGQDSRQGGTRRTRFETTLGRAARLLRRDRVAGVALVGVVAAAVITAVGFGGGPRTVLPTLSNVGAWLANDAKGSVTHANGLSGKPDAAIEFTDAAGHHLRVIQDGDIILVQDLDTGRVSRIDPVQLKATTWLPTKGMRLVVGAGVGYLVDPASGLVTRIDPVRLRLVGTPVVLPAPLGPPRPCDSSSIAGIDPHGTLWVPTSRTGSVVPIVNGVAGTPVNIGDPNDTLCLTLARGVPVVTDTTAGTLTVLAPSGGRLRLNLQLPGDDLVVPGTTGEPVVPLLARDTQRLVLVDTATGTPSVVTLTGVARHDLGAPQVLRGRLYVPDNTTGRLVVYDVASGRMLNPIRVGDGPGNIDLFVRDGLLWANDADGPNAVSIDPTGASHRIGKYQAALPGGALPTPSASPGGTAGNGSAPGDGGDRGGRGQPTPRPPAPRTTSPSSSPTAPAQLDPPTSVTETPRAGSILVTFSPAGGAPTDYTLRGTPAGAVVDPPRVGPAGPYQFTVTGLSCDQTYAFTVVANYPGGSRPATAGGSVRPCVAPSAPRGITLDAGTQKQLGVAWSAPASDGGGTLTYTVSWSGGASGTVSGRTGTSYTITGLANFTEYRVSVAAVNPAGSSQQPATASRLLAPSANTSATTCCNNRVKISLRAQPNTGSAILFSYPVGGGYSVQVVCRITGGYWSDLDDPSYNGDTWYKVSQSPQDGYVATGYVRPDAEVWDC